MVELTERERRIVHAMNIMNNPGLKNAPFDIKTKALQSVLLVYGFTWDMQDMTDLMQAITAEVEAGQQHVLKMLGKYGHLLDGMGKL